MPRILLVDDSPVARLAARRALDAVGLEVVEHDSLAASREVDARTLAGALLDLELGDGSGAELAVALRAAHADLPVAFFTSATREAARVAEALGPVYAKEAVAEAVRWLLSRCRST